jgi:hypothetical protein
MRAMFDALEIARKPAGRSLQLSTFDPETRVKTRRIEPGARATLGEIAGAGCLSRLWLTFPGWFMQHWSPDSAIDPTLLKALILRIYWDGAARPAVQAPVADFFGAGNAEFTSFTSLYAGTSSGGFYCLWPMPFRRGCRIEIENRHPSLATDVFLNANYQSLDAPIDDAGYFSAQFRTGRREGAEAATILDVEGGGNYVGTFLSMQGSTLNYFAYLEAPEYVYVDDDWEKPRIVGTGLEDYFNGGWYFRDGEFAGPHHGVPLKDPLRSIITMYRFHQADRIAFDRRMRFEFVNPWKADRLKPYWYSSVAFFYSERPDPEHPALASHAETLNFYRSRDRDHLSIP